MTMVKTQNEIQFDKKYDERKFNKWLLDVAPPGFIEFLKSKGSVNDSRFKAATKSEKYMEKSKLDVLKKGHLTYQMICIPDFMPLFEWCRREDDVLTDVKVKDQDVSADIRARYEESETDNVQELALQLFVNNAFEQAYELYEEAMTAQQDVQLAPTKKAIDEDIPMDDQTKTIKNLREKLKEFETKLNKATTAEKEAKAAQQKAEEQYKRAAKQLEDKKKQKESGKAEGKKMFEENTRLKQALCDVKETAEKDIAKLKEDKEALQKQLSDKNWDLGKLEEDQQKLQERNAYLQQVIRDLSAENNTYKQQIGQGDEKTAEVTSGVEALGIMTSEEGFKVDKALVDSMNETLRNKDKTDNRLFDFIPAKDEAPVITPQSTPVVEIVTPADNDTQKTYDFAILGNPKTAIRKVSTEKREKFAIYEASEKERFIAEYNQYKGAILFEMRCDRKMFEASAPDYVKQTIQYAETPMELMKLMEDM